VGLGRLLYEFAKLGYKAQGNEFSYYMLLTSNFILNCTNKKEEYEILPLIHSFSNVFWEDAPFKAVKIPDENLMEELSKSTGEMSMVAGEFVEVYKNQPEEWDSIVTCYFIDTANNIIEYIETIYRILKPGGLWINFGPLLYHYSEMDKECSIELSWDEVKHLIEKIGFEIKKEEIRESSYSTDCNSMLKTIYRCIYFTAVKVK
jgi:carnosine N-methyltransferase